MNSNPFFSKEIKPTRILKGFTIAFPCFIMILYLSFYFFDLIDSSLREYYVDGKEDQVLGVEKEKPHLIGSYGDVSEDDTFVWEWDPHWDREGYYKLRGFIENPAYFISEKEFTLKDNWELKDGYELTLSCKELDMTQTVAGDTYPCTLSYNGQIITENLRYEAYCRDFSNTESCRGRTSFKVFSDTYSDNGSDEYVVVSEYASGSKDWIYVYRLNKGKIESLPFLYNGKEEERWYISSNSYDMYGIYSTWENMKNFNDPLEFVTYFHEPSMGSQSEDYKNNVEGIYRIWSVEDNKLDLKENVIDLYTEEDIRHWL
jgi:hypothetical protein